MIIALLVIITILILLFSVRVGIKLELRDELILTAKLFGIHIRLMPKKQKKYKLRDYTPKKIAKRDAKAAEKARKKAEKKALKRAKKKAQKQEAQNLTKEQKRALKRKKREGRPQTRDLIDMFYDLSKLLFSSFFSHLHVTTSRIHIRVGGADAAQIALTWYAIYAACGGLIALLDKHSNLHGKRRADIQIVPDYLSERIETDLVIHLSMNLFGFLCVLLKLLVKGIVSWIGIQPPAKSSPSGASAQKTNTQTKKA